ncbi:MAG: D-alanyl-D-alanine carboxypeptidase family protein, partial [Desulfuromonadales bacterium]|nr:D-alanyl-D-alanine carboxypeptidase family protein [Desulfuromonadales bacterium]
HTGFAVDLDDARDPHYLRQSFDRTKAGRWLIENASRFCFELSFPRGNP